MPTLSISALNTSQAGQPSLAKPVTVDLWGNPNQILGDKCGPGAQSRAWGYFEKHPDHQYCLEAATHKQIARMNKLGGFTGAAGFPRSHAYNTHRTAEIEGPGPHGLVYYRGWHAQAAIQYRRSRFSAGVLIVPNYPVQDDLLLPADKQQFLWGCLWGIWEMFTGPNVPGAFDQKVAVS